MNQCTIGNLLSPLSRKRKNYTKDEWRRTLETGIQQYMEKSLNQMHEEVKENGNTSWSTKLEQEMVVLYTNFIKHSEEVCECYDNVPHHRPVLGAQNDQTKTQTAPVLSRHGDGEEGPPPGFEWIAEYMDMLTQYPKEEFYIEYSGKVARERLTEAFDTLKNMKESLTRNEKIWKQLQSLVRVEDASNARELRDVIRRMSFLNKKLALALDGENASPSILMRPPGEYTFDELRAECRLSDELVLRMLAGYGHQVPESKSTTKRGYAEIGRGEQGSGLVHDSDVTNTDERN